MEVSAEDEYEDVPSDTEELDLDVGKQCINCKRIFKRKKKGYER